MHVHGKKEKKKGVDSERLSGSHVHGVALLAPPDPEHLSVCMYSSYVHGAALLAPPNSERLSGSHVHAKGKKKKLMGGSTHVR